MINLSSFTTEYGVQNYDENNLEVYNKLEELSSQTQNLRNATNTVNVQDLAFKDVVGGFFSSGYSAMMLSFKSVDTFLTIYDQGMDDANLGDTGVYLRSFLFIALMITILIGIIISAILKTKV